MTREEKIQIIIDAIYEKEDGLTSDDDSKAIRILNNENKKIN